MAKTRLLVVGAGGHGRSVAEAAELSGQFAVVGFMDDSLAAGDISLVCLCWARGLHGRSLSNCAKPW